MEEELKNKDTIEVNGYSGLYLSQDGSLRALVKTRTVRLATGVLLLALCFISVTAAYLFLRTKYAIDAVTLETIFYVSLILVIFLFSAIFEKKSGLFSKLVEKILDKF
jgi:uncharacterized membrane protein (DUF485 family)